MRPIKQSFRLVGLFWKTRKTSDCEGRVSWGGGERKRPRKMEYLIDNVGRGHKKN